VGKDLEKMKSVRLGNTNEQISCIGLGTMYFGTKVDEQTSFSILDYYVEKGGSFLDSANKYASWIPGFQGGESELLIGKWLKEKANRDKIFLTSKVGFPYEDIPRSLKKEIIISECNRSLKRLGVETIDLYFAHAYDAKTLPEEVMEAFSSLKKQGKIKFSGASNYSSWQLSEADHAAKKLGVDSFTCLQQRHTFLEPGLRANFGTQLVLTSETEEYCQIQKLTIMAYSPLLGGAYVNSNKPIPAQYQSADNDLRIKNLNRLAKDLNVSPNALVLRWMIQSTPAVIPIVAGSTVAQLEENMEALTFILNDEQLALLNQDIVKANKYS
jgi:aryl-alcohol dehydrogenase-like predicted oxidoreductase